ncbi:MAG: AMP-binding protein [Alteromonadaceae bacterium]|nr:AMP-binding protein [Alteromonadaceae bacterium]
MMVIAMSEKIKWQRSDIEVLLLDLVSQACKNNVENTALIKQHAQQTDARNCWLLDSLSSYQAVAYVSDFFQVEDESVLDEFLNAPNLESLANVALVGLQQTSAKIKFYTSGSQSKPKAVIHELSALQEEAAAWQRLYQKPDTVYVAVPQHHIYGFIWGCLMPKLWQTESVDIRSSLLHKLNSKNSSILVTIPSFLSTMGLMKPEQLDKLNVVISTAPCDFRDIRGLYALGCNNVTQIYGATETGGVGYRNQNSPFYQLRTDLCLQHEQVFKHASKLPLQDDLRFIDTERFEVIKRKDGKIQVNGYNVDVSHLLEELKRVEGVKDAVIRIEGVKTHAQLNAFVVTDGHVSNSSLLRSITKECGEFIFPQNVMFGDRIPRNEMGKVSSWLS